MPVDPVSASLVMMGIGGATKALGSIFDDTNQKRADMMRKEADLKLSALEETMRRAEGRQAQVMSSTKAAMGASGFSADSKSFTSYLTDMASEFARQNSVTKQQGLESIDLIRQGADIEGDNTQKWFQALTSGLNTTTNILSQMKPEP